MSYGITYSRVHAVMRPKEEVSEGARIFSGRITKNNNTAFKCSTNNHMEVTARKRCIHIPTCEPQIAKLICFLFITFQT